ncbi:DP-EP family protein [Nitrospirillum viridazoti]|uniref:Calx-beta domain-containing protein n=1 Tax=Nitrospirillum viridazoti CBAmc TaxID=1441467 RepID=A0A248K0H5_9PROT|nr:DP-EP family protein [Nitrospirillum amazonense]ASG23908.1 hypothetical protein Y958_23415 [Nitrospirillum amazonense CBAmc]TWB44660.1 uncharacterized protein DUF1888 [Nitrospirillum amazonense]
MTTTVNPPPPITITITAIAPNAWTYEGPGVDPTTGHITLPNQGPTQIIYQLAEDLQDTYNLVFANLSPTHCITAQVTQITYGDSTITINDANDWGPGATGRRPFGFILVARLNDDTGTAILSPDPEVDNNPPIRPPVA